MQGYGKITLNKDRDYEGEFVNNAIQGFGTYKILIPEEETIITG